MNGGHQSTLFPEPGSQPKVSINYMQSYEVNLEISDPIALWARLDTLLNPVSYVAPTFSAVKGIFEAILRWKTVNVRPTRCEICVIPAPLEIVFDQRVSISAN